MTEIVITIGVGLLSFVMVIGAIALALVLVVGLIVLLRYVCETICRYAETPRGSRVMSIGFRVWLVALLLRLAYLAGEFVISRL